MFSDVPWSTTALTVSDIALSTKSPGICFRPVPFQTEIRLNWGSFNGQVVGVKMSGWSSDHHMTRPVVIYWFNHLLLNGLLEADFCYSSMKDVKIVFAVVFSNRTN